MVKIINNKGKIEDNITRINIKKEKHYEYNNIHDKHIVVVLLGIAEEFYIFSNE